MNHKPEQEENYRRKTRSHSRTKPRSQSRRKTTEATAGGRQELQQNQKPQQKGDRSHGMVAISVWIFVGISKKDDELIRDKYE
jgi:hypothetical protein